MSYKEAEREEMKEQNDELQDVEQFDALDEEDEAMGRLSPSASDDLRWLGIDPYGADFMGAGVRERHRLVGAPLFGESLRRALLARS